MLRLTVLLLLLANAVYYAWSHGFLAAAGLEPARQTEPHRLQQQIKPDALRIVPLDDARREPAAAIMASRGAECLQAGLFEQAQVAGLRQALESWPAGSWSLESGVEPARWIVYMGKYLTVENVSRKKAELRQMGVSFEAVSDPVLEPGLSLGGFTTQAAATQHMDALAQRGIRTAKVVQERAEQRGEILRLAGVDDALRARLEDIRPALNGKNLRPCR
jgi:hypothetical protein